MKKIVIAAGASLLLAITTANAGDRGGGGGHILFGGGLGFGYGSAYYPAYTYPDHVVVTGVPRRAKVHRVSRHKLASVHKRAIRHKLAASHKPVVYRKLTRLHRHVAHHRVATKSPRRLTRNLNASPAELNAPAYGFKPASVSGFMPSAQGGGGFGGGSAPLGDSTGGGRAIIPSFRGPAAPGSGAPGGRR